MIIYVLKKNSVNRKKLRNNHLHFQNKHPIISRVLSIKTGLIDPVFYAVYSTIFSIPFSLHHRKYFSIAN
jgi:hypothetical protein